MIRTTRHRGFTLIETLIAVSITGILSSVAYPSFAGHLQRARRTDALVAVMQAQLAEERFRADHSVYGNLAEIGLRSTSMSGHYTLQVASSSGNGYVLVATAAGAQARDTICRTLRLGVAGSDLSYASGPDASASNPDDVNRRCWNR
ncbi:MAG: prepilin-type N-terminal cleavage/methylation domain-containing protein [Pseudomonadota bacterium]|nr:prepilin-type N-terminal cleavage/methylation domain-containing protein [Pseudomonadota bacterium]